ncbi:hypothetical protein EMIHUDRAFT_458458 [Emiliania huxleyi CCMP1516]|uniref:Uncharacterized protein n=2 Tax=Emiliania huxleyi TaxID=2903 RepID=A0A0D3JCE4_EMIH1|nr:hypothetical protein EMIHUDRAFT_458458 [Emiliania huxleyi CCMP1516]EOD21179.1 hypothetical protein EMIHUDRAFT_458458 [Emiliania huxleyi CCMP1516]|eukprot:XP_005773608.1 hypothetical protein EMIHUDRAFT_458458 [Emiliania huxleyi CCMP1516]
MSATPESSHVSFDSLLKRARENDAASRAAAATEYRLRATVLLESGAHAEGLHRTLWQGALTPTLVDLAGLCALYTGAVAPIDAPPPTMEELSQCSALRGFAHQLREAQRPAELPPADGTPSSSSWPQWRAPQPALSSDGGPPPIAAQPAPAAGGLRHLRGPAAERAACPPSKAVAGRGGARSSERLRTPTTRKARRAAWRRSLVKSLVTRRPPRRRARAASCRRGIGAKST